MNYALDRKLDDAKETIESTVNKAMHRVKSDHKSAADTTSSGAVNLVQNLTESGSEILAEKKESCRHSWWSAEGYVASMPWRAVAATSLSGRMVESLFTAGRPY